MSDRERRLERQLDRQDLTVRFLKDKLSAAEKEEGALKRQLTECLEFIIWLKGYEYTGGPIEERLTDLLERLAASSPVRGELGGEE